MNGYAAILVVALCIAVGRLPGQTSQVTPAPMAARKPPVGKKAGETRDDNLVKMKLIWCPPGTFKMGSPKEVVGTKVFDYDSLIHQDEVQVEVKLSHGFWMGKFEVTQYEWVAIIEKNPSHHKGEKLPVESVAWAEAVDFCKQFTKLEHNAGRLPKGWEYRLPTEAQWEYACRAGSTNYFFFGGFKEAKAKLDEYAWSGLNSGDKTPSNRFKPQTRRTHPVGQKKANPWGFHDIIGNVMEWTQDWHSDKLPGGTDPVQTKRSDKRVTRGSYYLGSRGSCRSAMRGRIDADRQSPSIGFRVVLAKTKK